jgi:hypothetical protein
MWDDLLELILNCVLELLDVCVDPEEFWRFSLCFCVAAAFTCLVEWLSREDRPLRAVSILLIGSVTGVYWEWRSRKG